MNETAGHRNDGKTRPPGDGVDLRFVWREVGRFFLLLVALVPYFFTWTLTTGFGTILAIPLIVSYLFDRDAFPVFVAQSLNSLAFVWLRGVADDTGMPWQTAYVVGADRVIGLGHNPTAVLQAWLRHPWVDQLAC